MDSEKISNLVLSSYEKKLNKTCKPVLKSNGIKEWTVLAAIVAYDTGEDTYTLVSMATGVKVTSEEELGRSNGKMLHDCHAEVLALRSFNAVIHHQVNSYCDKNASECFLIEKLENTNSFQVKDKFQFCLYISKPPCGDASMEEEQGAADSDMNSELREFQDDDSIQYVQAGNKTILRGRFNYSKKGFVRTKPGRADSKISFSKSCSDKLCMSQVTSINNSITYKLLEKPIYLSAIIIPGLSNKSLKELERSFKRPGKLIKVPVEFLTTSENFPDDKSDNLQSPSLISGVWLNLENGMQPKQEVILNGIKNGFFVKGKKPLRKNCESFISRYHQWKLFSSNDYYTSYLSYKKTLTKRNALINELRLKMSTDGWIHTLTDDCQTTI